MAERLVWNFEIDAGQSTAFSFLPSNGQALDNGHWEARFFWPGNSVVLLHGLGDECLDLSNYQIKHRLDTYLLLADSNENLKIRKGKLLYKPLLDKSPHAFAYGKKIHLDPSITESHTQVLRRRANHASTQITVDKQALIFPVAVSPKTKLELARMNINGMIYYSVSIESRALSMVERLSQILVANKRSSNYVDFLKSIAIRPAK